MVAPVINRPAYRESRGHGEFCTPSGQRVVIYADDKTVIAELKRRGLWDKVECQAVLGLSFVFRDTTPDGADIFMWFGHTEDGGFSWYAFPGATKDTPEVRDFMNYAAIMLFGTEAPAGAEGVFSHGLS
jgi:hypothetical protein